MQSSDRRHSFGVCKWTPTKLNPLLLSLIESCPSMVAPAGCLCVSLPHRDTLVVRFGCRRDRRRRRSLQQANRATVLSHVSAMPWCTDADRSGINGFPYAAPSHCGHDRGLLGTLDSRMTPPSTENGRGLCLVPSCRSLSPEAIRAFWDRTRRSASRNLMALISPDAADKKGVRSTKHVLVGFTA
jgi:hypothetical protein